MHPPPRIDDPAAIATLREVLDRAPYTAESIRDALGSGDEILSRNRDIPVHLRRLRDRGGFGALVRLFVLNLDVSIDEARAALAPLALERAATMGIIAENDGRVSPLLRLVPHDDLVIASDLRLLPGQPMPHDHVPGVHRPSVTLAHLTVRRHVANALDLGTGCGVEALLLARHADAVVGSDVSARAVAFAAFNGQLNRVANVEWRVGSWFGPIGDMRFGVIACNPPYVISPETQYIYRDSGMRGDSVSEQVVREVAAHLDDGAFGTVTVSWVADPENADANPVRRWVEGTGCDAWILHYRTEDPLTTAKSWNEQDATDAAAYAATLDRWLAYYERLGIRAIAYGAVILRRRSGAANWVRTDPLPAGRLSPASAHILRVFGAEDALASASDEAILASRLRVVPSAVLTRTRSFGDGAERIELSLDEGLGFQAEIDEHVVRVLARLEGRTLREALAAAAKDAGLADADRARFVGAGPHLARRLLATGLIEPVSV
jgi:methylase of polypeptide subunit release factors